MQCFSPRREGWPVKSACVHQCSASVMCVLVSLCKPFDLESTFLFLRYRVGHQVVYPEIQYLLALPRIDLISYLLHVLSDFEMGNCIAFRCTINGRKNAAANARFDVDKNLIIDFPARFGMYRKIPFKICTDS